MKTKQELRPMASGLISMQRRQRALPFERIWKNSGSAFQLGSSLGARRDPFLITRPLRKCDMNLRFSCCCCIRMTSSFSPKSASNFFCRLNVNVSQPMLLESRP